MVDASQLSPVSAMLIAQVERELAAMRAADQAADDAARQMMPSKRRRDGSSTVFTLRLDPSELEALQRRASARGIPPSVLARNLIRVGMQPPSPDDDLAHAVEQLEAALAAVRAALPAH